MKLYELVGRDPNMPFSPFAWRSKLALAHKGLKFESVPLRFTEIADTLSFADSKTVPVLVDGENIIPDSWHIACYIQDAYPDGADLFGGPRGRAAAHLFGFQMGMPLLMPLFRTLVSDIYKILDERDQDFFRKTREPRIGCTIEDAAENYHDALVTFQNNLIPYEAYLKSSEYFCGDSPAYQDYCFYSLFLWARATSPKSILKEDSPIKKWLDKMDGLFDGLGGNIKLIK
ncbi:glutathione S-transferase N-terminal domain-containing protein [Pseudemcibacter aquimaris]|uniref:glutathione S-transferase N-terminal domain-containing protein n=1 Tax=Pseudemcibacter aquimaris TaxID=2857064 RepID=UPI00201266DD|nr:glutathione S-transferase N-terminal domain-containing protein [Pseudemcibacter aquimaris]MCC3861941.1 glutathione S-transferase N-terminal domain-containing protein [Pseudemcibacter aquimaris]WDU58693.1 glutathione S-transferase N-terminal domain-containing protein [Pseudemcibacter aquimaris]